LAVMKGEPVEEYAVRLLVDVVGWDGAVLTKGTIRNAIRNPDNEDMLLIGISGMVIPVGEYEVVFPEEDFEKLLTQRRE